MASQLLTSTSPSLVEMLRLQDNRMQDGQLPQIASYLEFKEGGSPLDSLGNIYSMSVFLPLDV